MLRGRPCARASLSVVLSLASVGCIVAEPPPYDPPPRTPPILDLANAIPWVGSTIPVDRYDDTFPEEQTKIAFNIPFRSEDQGEPLRYGLHVDYLLVPSEESSTNIDRRTLTASTFDDENRRITFDWTVRLVGDGCHQLTLLVAHDSSWNNDESRPDPLLGRGDIATATWWINVNPAPGERYTLRNCRSLESVIER